MTGDNGDDDKDCVFGEDRISELPEDIILNILSAMTMKEAAKTSIVSKRWRYVWGRQTHLDFDHSLIALKNDFFLTPATEAEKGKYINWVNQVVGLNCSPCLDTFRVSFGFGSSDACHFDKWVRFALLRKVKNLELSSTRRTIVYTLGFDILKPSVVSIGNSGLRITSLTSLHLSYIDVSGDFIEFLLSECHHLERLYVLHSSLLVRLKVIGLSCKLKQLAIRHCRYLKELEIDALDLMCFDYTGMNIHTNLVLKRMPMLVEATFGGSCFGTPVSIFRQISHLAPNIYKLSLNNDLYKFPDGALPTFSNLRHLYMVASCYQTNLFNITSFLDVCPMLHELKIMVHRSLTEHEREASLLKRMDQSSGNHFAVDLDDYFNLGQTEPKTRPNLKLLEVVGYGGSKYDVDIILSIMHSAKNLDTIVIDPTRTDVSLAADLVDTSRARAYKIKRIILPKIRVVII